MFVQFQACHVPSLWEQNTPSRVEIPAIPLFLKRLNVMGIIFSSVIIVLLLVVFAAVTQAAVEYLVDCDDNNTKEEM